LEKSWVKKGYWKHKDKEKFNFVVKRNRVETKGDMVTAEFASGLGKPNKTPDTLYENFRKRLHW
jgi:hypothetical protein